MPPALRPPSRPLRVRPAVRGLLSAAIVAIAGLAVVSRGPDRVRFESHVISPISDAAVPFNALGNAEDDFAVLAGQDLVRARIMAGEPRAVRPLHFASPVWLSGAMDVDGDGLDEVCLSTRDSIGGWAVIVGRDDRRMVLGPVRDSVAAGSRSQTAALGPIATLVPPGQAPLVLCAVTSMRQKPRGVALFDPRTGSMRWFHPMGAWPDDILAADLLRDGRTQVLVAGGATNNGLSDNGTDDAHSWAVALDDSGSRLWKAEVGGELSRVRLLPLSATRARPSRVVAATRSHSGENPRPCALEVLDGRSGAGVRRLEFPQSLGSPRLLDAAAGTFVVGGADGVLRAFDGDLHALAKFRVGSAVEAWACVDVAGDGTRWVVASTDRDVLVLDEQLRPLGRTRLAESRARDPIGLKLARAGLRNWRVCTTSGKVTVLDLRRVPPLADRPRVAGVLGLGAAAGVAAAAWRRRPRRLPGIAESREFLVDYRQVRHDILDDVRPFGALWNWAHEAVAGTQVPIAVFERARDEYLGIGRGTVRRFVERAEALLVDEERVQRLRSLAGELEALLGSPAGGPPDETSRRAREAAHAMRELSDACAAAYREVASREPCRADRVLHESLHALHGSLMDRSVAVDTNVDPNAAVPVLFDAAELRALFGQLIENAATALAGREDARIRLSLKLDPADHRRVVARVEDNGPGIAADRREAVFRPDVSTRAGGGFGLAHAREVARSWRGDLTIDEAPEGGGASLRLVLVALFPFEPNGSAKPADAARGDRA